MPRALHRADVGAPHARAPIAAGSAGEPAAEPVGAEVMNAILKEDPVDLSETNAKISLQFQSRKSIDPEFRMLIDEKDICAGDRHAGL